MSKEELKELTKKARKLARPFRVTDDSFRLKDFDPGDTRGVRPPRTSRAPRRRSPRASSVLAELQDMLYAQDRWGVLLIFQAMDAAGKDGAIKHVMSGVNPQGCQVYSFKAPVSEELDHDFLWRCMRCLPERGRIGIFNRCYYEETLVVRVHPEFLESQQLPAELRHEGHLGGALPGHPRVRALPGPQRHRRPQVLPARLEEGAEASGSSSGIDEPEKNWKFSASDVEERGYWDEYMDAYEDMIRNTATEHAPWYVVPADNKWFTRVVVAAAVIDTLASLDLAYPTVSEAKLKSLAAAKRSLLGER